MSIQTTSFGKAGACDRSPSSIDLQLEQYAVITGSFSGNQANARPSPFSSKALPLRASQEGARVIGLRS
jgi:hypothetical protein